MAKLTKSFRGVPAGEIYPVQYKPGDECPPELEDAARSLGAISEGVSKKGAGGKKDGDGDKKPGDGEN